MELQVIKADGKQASPLQVSEQTFGTAFNEPLVHQVVIAHLAGARAGTRQQKNRSAVRGGGSKPYRQKGTGRARAGTIRSPIWRGGGRAFPASTKDYSQKVNRKMYRLAMRAILSELVRQERLVVCDELQMTMPKTKELAGKLRQLQREDVLIVSDHADENLWLSARNLHKVYVCDAGHIDPVVLIGHEAVIMTSKAVRQIEEWLQ